ncbi:MAG TPA: hypothetical protein VD994_12875 [Prosthecobacter sp.]|nr:hypothetical protein [Prosthecobacter sp.]
MDDAEFALVAKAVGEERANQLRAKARAKHPQAAKKTNLLDEARELMAENTRRVKKYWDADRERVAAYQRKSYLRRKRLVKKPRLKRAA